MTRCAPLPPPSAITTTMSDPSALSTALACPRCHRPMSASAIDGLCPGCLGMLSFETESTTGGGDIAPSEPPQPSEFAQFFPQLEIETFLGRGGMGMVYRARQRSLERPVALKLLSPELASDPNFSRRFAREARLLAALSHPGIVTIYDSGEAGGYFYLLMEFVDGQNLRELLKTRRLEREEVLAFMHSICDALRSAHQRGIVHRDIKPENLLIDGNFKIKIADFGIAQILNEGAVPESSGTLPSSRSALTLALGTPAYIAPEQSTGGGIDHRADIFSLGIVFHEMLLGMRPEPGGSMPSTVLEPGLEAIVRKATAEDPAERYQCAQDFADAIEFVRQKHVGRRRGWHWRVAAAVVISATLATLVYSWTERQAEQRNQPRERAVAALSASLETDPNAAWNLDQAESISKRYQEEIIALQEERNALKEEVSALKARRGLRLQEELRTLAARSSDADRTEILFNRYKEEMKALKEEVDSLYARNDESLRNAISKFYFKPIEPIEPSEGKIEGSDD